MLELLEYLLKKNEGLSLGSQRTGFTNHGIVEHNLVIPEFKRQNRTNYGFLETHCFRKECEEAIDKEINNIWPQHIYIWVIKIQSMYSHPDG